MGIMTFADDVVAVLQDAGYRVELAESESGRRMARVFDIESRSVDPISTYFAADDISALMLTLVSLLGDDAIGLAVER